MSEAKEIKKQRIALLASRASGIIPIKDFVAAHTFQGRVKYALEYGVNEGLFYYLDDITKKKFISIPGVGIRNWFFLVETIEIMLLEINNFDHWQVLRNRFKM